MSHPILYSATETDFSHNGFGILGDCASCEVTEEANGVFELAMTYPIDGIHYEDIADRAIIKAKADQFRDPQFFRIYAISKPVSGIVTVLAEHISYDLTGIPVSPFSATSVSSALLGLKNNAVVDCPFEFWTDKDTSANFSVSTPASIRSRLGGVAGSVLDVYGGEYEFDNYTVKLHNSRGVNRGVSIRYGKNLTDFQQEQNCSSLATGIYPYWAGDVEGTTVLVELPEKIVNAPGTYNFVKIRTVDFTSVFETQPTVDQLRRKTESYIKENEIGVPRVSMSVSFAQLEQTEEYKNLKLLERISLFDTVNVEFPALGVSATAKAVKIIYDVISDRVKSVSLGSVRANIADTIATQQTDINQAKEKPSLSMVQKISASLAKALTGANGGSVRLIDTNDDGDPDELYIADNPDPLLAVKVWRFNYNGWAASKNGYAGPFEFGATLEDGLLANFVTAAQLVAGTIKSQNGESIVMNLDTGEVSLKNVQIDGTGGGASFTNCDIYTIASKTWKASDYTADDLNVIAEIYVSGNEPTREQLARYDFNLNRRIESGDAVTLSTMLSTGLDTIVTWKCRLSPEDENSVFEVWQERTVGGNTSRHRIFLVRAGVVESVSLHSDEDITVGDERLAVCHAGNTGVSENLLSDSVSASNTSATMVCPAGACGFWVAGITTSGSSQAGTFVPFELCDGYTKFQFADEGNFVGFTVSLNETASHLTVTYVDGSSLTGTIDYVSAFYLGAKK